MDTALVFLLLFSAIGLMAFIDHLTAPRKPDPENLEDDRLDRKDQPYRTRY